MCSVSRPATNESTLVTPHPGVDELRASSTNYADSVLSCLPGESALKTKLQKTDAQSSIRVDDTTTKLSIVFTALALVHIVAFAIQRSSPYLRAEPNSEAPPPSCGRLRARIVVYLAGVSIGLISLAGFGQSYEAPGGVPAPGTRCGLFPSKKNADDTSVRFLLFFGAGSTVWSWLYALTTYVEKRRGRERKRGEECKIYVCVCGCDVRTNTGVTLLFLPLSSSIFICFLPYPSSSRYLALWTSFAAILPPAATPTPEVSSNSRYPELARGYRQCYRGATGQLAKPYSSSFMWKRIFWTIIEVCWQLYVLVDSMKSQAANVVVAGFVMIGLTTFVLPGIVLLARWRYGWGYAVIIGISLELLFDTGFLVSCKA